MTVGGCSQCVRTLVNKTIQSHTIIQAFWHVCVCTYIPRDAVMTVTLSEVVLLFVGFLFTPKLPGSPLPVPKPLSLSTTLCLPAWMKASLWPRISSSSLSLSPFFHFCMQQSNLNSTHWRFLVCVCVFRGWIVSLPCPIPFVSQMEKWAPLFVPGVLWLRTTSGFVWREGQKQRGREKEEVGNPPRPPNPPLPPSYWPLSIVPAGLLWALSPNQSGYQKGQRSLVAFYGP